MRLWTFCSVFYFFASSTFTAPSFGARSLCQLNVGCAGTAGNQTIQLLRHRRRGHALRMTVSRADVVQLLRRFRLSVPMRFHSKGSGASRLPSIHSSPTIAANGPESAGNGSRYRCSPEDNVAPDNASQSLVIDGTAQTISVAPELCNGTIEQIRSAGDVGDGTLTLRMERLKHVDRGKTLYCWFRFRARVGQAVEVRVKNVRAGTYDDDESRCKRGWLRVSDSDACGGGRPDWAPPSTFCGTGQRLDVRRITRSRSALVEFRLDKVKPSRGYEFKVKFVDKPNDAGERPYGSNFRRDGLVPNTLCDWLIPVDLCLGSCHAVSPGYPGIYPPFSKCRYLFTNFDSGRVLLKIDSFLIDFSQVEAGIDARSAATNLKPQKRKCSKDVLYVYDGASEGLLLARFCGTSAGQLVSSQSSMLVVFSSGPDGPVWRRAGFRLTYVRHWATHHPGGTHVDGSVCDWLFESGSIGSGSLHTPDTKLDPGSTCFYTFSAIDADSVITLTIKLHRRLAVDCSEYLEFLVSSRVTEKICDDRLTGNSSLFEFVFKTERVVLRYVNVQGQLSQSNPVWIAYRFPQHQGHSSVAADFVNDSNLSLPSPTAPSACRNTRTATVFLFPVYLLVAQSL